LQKPLKAHRICHWVRIGSFMVSPPFATAKAGDDFPFRNPSTPRILEKPKAAVLFSKKFEKIQNEPVRVLCGQAHRN